MPHRVATALGVTAILALAPAVCAAQPVPPAVAECDLLTAHPDDPRRVAPPVARGHRDATRAIPACEAALRLDPNNPRIAFQLGLAHDAARDHSRSIELYRRAAQAGYAAATFAIGWAYANGEGVERNDVLAVQAYERAAAAGHTGAQNTLGFMYENGRGVTKDLALAAQWYGRAAAAGRSISQFNLGRLMSSGRGVPQDIDGAVRLYRAAVQAGRSDAALHLAIVAEQGRAPKVGRAEMLFAFALAEFGADQRERARRSLDAAGSAEEVRAARAQAAEVAARLERTLEQEAAQREAALTRLRPDSTQDVGAAALAAAERRAVEEARQRAEADAAAARLARAELEKELERLRQVRMAAASAPVPAVAPASAPANAPEPPRAPTLAELRAAPMPFSAEYATVAGEVGCRSTEPQSARVARFREQYENREIVWQGKVRSVSPASVTLDMGGQRDEVIAALVAGHDTASVATGSTVMVRFRLTAPGSCNQAFRGTEGVLLRIDGRTIQ